MWFFLSLSLSSIVAVVVVIAAATVPISFTVCYEKSFVRFGYFSIRFRIQNGSIVASTERRSERRQGSTSPFHFHTYILIIRSERAICVCVHTQHTLTVCRLEIHYSSFRRLIWFWFGVLLPCTQYIHRNRIISGWVSIYVCVYVFVCLVAIDCTSKIWRRVPCVG